MYPHNLRLAVEHEREAELIASQRGNTPEGLNYYLHELGVAARLYAQLDGPLARDLHLSIPAGERWSVL